MISFVSILFITILIAIPVSAIDVTVKPFSYNIVRGSLVNGSISDTYYDDSNYINIIEEQIVPDSEDVITVQPFSDLSTVDLWTAFGCATNQHYDCVNDANYPLSNHDGDSSVLNATYAGAREGFAISPIGNQNASRFTVSNIEIIFAGKQYGPDNVNLRFQLWIDSLSTGIATGQLCIDNTFGRLSTNYTNYTVSTETCNGIVPDITDANNIRLSMERLGFTSGANVTAISVRVTLKPIQFLVVVDFTFQVTPTGIPQEVDWVCVSPEDSANIWTVKVFDFALQSFENVEAFTACDNTLHSFGGLDFDNNVNGVSPPAINKHGGKTIIRFQTNAPNDWIQYILPIDFVSIRYEKANLTGNDLSVLLVTAMAIGTVVVVAYIIAKWRGFI